MKNQTINLFNEFCTYIGMQAKNGDSFANMEDTIEDYKQRIGKLMADYASSQMEEPSHANTIICEGGVKARFKGVEKKT